MNKIVAIADNMRYNGDKEISKRILELSKYFADNYYIMRSGKYNGIQSIFNKEFSKFVRENKQDEFKKLFIYEECPKTKQLMGSTRHYNILYNTSNDLERYQKRVVSDKKGFDDILLSIIGKNYKYVSEVYKESYRVMMAQMIGNDLKDINKAEFVITNNIRKDDNIRSYDIINGTQSVLYWIAEYFDIELFDIRDM